MNGFCFYLLKIPGDKKSPKFLRGTQWIVNASNKMAAIRHHTSNRRREMAQILSVHCTTGDHFTLKILCCFFSPQERCVCVCEWASVGVDGVFLYNHLSKLVSTHPSQINKALVSHCRTMSIPLQNQTAKTSEAGEG